MSHSGDMKLEERQEKEGSSPNLSGWLWKGTPASETGSGGLGLCVEWGWVQGILSQEEVIDHRFKCGHARFRPVHGALKESARWVELHRPPRAHC